MSISARSFEDHYMDMPTALPPLDLITAPECDVHTGTTAAPALAPGMLGKLTTAAPGQTTPPADQIPQQQAVTPSVSSTAQTPAALLPHLPRSNGLIPYVRFTTATPAPPKHDDGGFNPFKALGNAVGWVQNKVDDGVNWAEGEIDQGVNWVESETTQGLNAVVAPVKDVPILGPLAQATASGIEQDIQIPLGFGKEALHFVGGLVQAVDHPIRTVTGLETMAEHVPMAGGNPLKLSHGLYDVLSGSMSWQDFVAHDVDPVQSAKDDGAFYGKVVNAVIDPYKKDVAQGKYGEAVGGILFDVLSVVATDGAGAGVEGVADTARVADVATDVARLTDTARVLDDGSRITDVTTDATRGVTDLPLGGRGPTVRPTTADTGYVTGPASGRVYFPDEIGLPVEKLTTDGVTITNQGIDTVVQHLERFGPDAENAAAVERLRDIVAGRLEATPYDLNFYTHELREFDRYTALGYEAGLPPTQAASLRMWNNLHSATLEDYGLAGEADLYHPDVLAPRMSRPAVTATSGVDEARYAVLRKKSPSTAIRAAVNDVPEPRIDPVYGFKVAKLEADHTTSLLDVTNMPDFGKLTAEEQLEIANMRDNFLGLSRRPNGSKGALSWADWPGHKELGVVPPEFRAMMVQRAAEARAVLQQRIETLVSRRHGSGASR